jgi:hypothetical protein
MHSVEAAEVLALIDQQFSDLDFRTYHGALALAAVLAGDADFAFKEYRAGATGGPNPLPLRSSSPSRRRCGTWTLVSRRSQIG